MPLVRDLVVGLWIAWLVSWLAASRWTGRTEKKVKGPPAWTYRGLMLAGGLLLAAPFWARGIPPLWPMTDAAAWLLTALAAAGFTLAWWARIHLGKLWSSAVTRKADHRVVASGPYRLVRHPIYSGVILAALATAALTQRLLPLAGAALLMAGFCVKARIEERFLRAELGAADYDAYAARVPMLLPFPKF